MSYQRFSLFLFCIVVAELPCSTIYAQSSLHYVFKSGERIQYHYLIKVTSEGLGNHGEREKETDFEADPEWSIEDVSMTGEARAILTLRSRTEYYVRGESNPNFLHFTPQSEIAVDRSGRMLFGKILIDDTERTLSKQIADKVSGIHLLPDNEALLPQFQRLWFALDTLPLDTLGAPYMAMFDSTVAQPFEIDTKLPGRMDEYLTATINPFRYSGKSTYMLHDTTIGSRSFWIMRTATNANSVNPSYPDLPNKSIRMTDILFRKEDGLIQSWHYTFENHNGATESNSEMWMTLTSIEGD